MQVEYYRIIPGMNPEKPETVSNRQG